MVLVMNTPIPASPAFQNLILYLLTVVKYFPNWQKICFFFFKTDPFNHEDKNMSNSKGQKTATGMFLQQLEIKDFISWVSDSFRVEQNIIVKKQDPIHVIHNLLFVLFFTPLNYLLIT